MLVEGGSLLISVKWGVAALVIVFVWILFITDVLPEVAWLPAKLVLNLDLAPLNASRAWTGAQLLQICVTMLLMAVMVAISVIVGGWFRRYMAVIQTANSFRLVLLPLFAPIAMGVAVASLEPMRGVFKDWPSLYNPFPGYLTVWVLTLGYMMKLPWDCATLMLQESGLWARIGKAHAARQSRRAK